MDNRCIEYMMPCLSSQERAWWKILQNTTIHEGQNFVLQYSANETTEVFVVQNLIPITIHYTKLRGKK